MIIEYRNRCGDGLCHHGEAGSFTRSEQQDGRQRPPCTGQRSSCRLAQVLRIPWRATRSSQVVFVSGGRTRHVAQNTIQGPRRSPVSPGSAAMYRRRECPLIAHEPAFLDSWPQNTRTLSARMVSNAIQVEESMRAMLFSYRKRCAPNSPSGQLILPEALRVLPLLTLCTHKMLALRPNNQVRVLCGFAECCQRAFQGLVPRHSGETKNYLTCVRPHRLCKHCRYLLQER